MDAIRNCFREGGYQWTDEDGMERGGTFLVGYHGKLIQIFSDFQFLAFNEPWFAAIGSGRSYAIGAMTAGASPMIALMATGQNCSEVRGPYYILEQAAEKGQDGEREG